MNQLVYRPINRIGGLHQELNRIFDNRLFPLGTQETRESAVDWKPLVDIQEQDDSFLVHVDVPGVEAKDIEISLEKNVLTIEGTRTTTSESSSSSVSAGSTETTNDDSTANSAEGEDANQVEVESSPVSYYRKERFSGTFLRQFSLPETADADNISARVTNGVLEISIPKSEKSQRRTIAVQG